MVFFIALILLSAFFSSAEAAYFTISKELLQGWNGSASPRSRRIFNLLTKPRQLLITILLGNTIVKVAAASVVAVLSIEYGEKFFFSKELAILIAVLVVALVLFFFSELLPRIIAINNAYKIANVVSLPLTIAFYVLFPLAALLNRFPALFSGFFLGRIKRNFLSKDELQTLIEINEKAGALEAEEKEMIHSIFELSKTTVREIMVPRIDMICVEKATTLTKLIDLIHSKGHTRIPLFAGTVDNILGIIHAKELLPLIKNKHKKVDLVSLARPAMFVPESKHVDELLNELQAERQHMAIVVDEYGGTAGLITLEDVIEEIVGEIQDEYDKEKPLITKIDDTHYSVDAKMDLVELNSELNLNLPEDKNYDSLGGFIFDLIGSVPEKEQKIEYGHCTFIIERVDKNRIVKVLIIKNQNSD